MKNLIEFLKEVSGEKLTLSERMGAPIITTTQRSEIKNRFMDAVYKDIMDAVNTATDENYLNADVIMGYTADGLVVAVENPSLRRLENQEIPFKIEVKVANLDYNTSLEIELFEEEQTAKKQEAEIKAKAKAEKIARDQSNRKATLKAKGYDVKE